MNLKAIGTIHTPFKEVQGTPIQTVFAEGATGTVELWPEYVDGLQDLVSFERVWLLYWLDRCPSARIKVTPFRDTQERGVFATRAPCRPNPVGLSCVRLLEVKGHTLFVQDVDVLDGTPLLDIKPYVPHFDAFPGCRAGWYDASSEQRTRADDRFRGS